MCTLLREELSLDIRGSPSLECLSACGCTVKTPITKRINLLSPGQFSYAPVLHDNFRFSFRKGSTFGIAIGKP